MFLYFDIMYNLFNSIINKITTDAFPEDTSQVTKRILVKKAIPLSNLKN